MDPSDNSLHDEDLRFVLDLPLNVLVDVLFALPVRQRLVLARAHPTFYHLTSNAGFLYPGVLGTLWISVARGSQLRIPTSVWSDDDFLYLDCHPTSKHAPPLDAQLAFLRPRLLAFAAIGIEAEPNITDRDPNAPHVGALLDLIHESGWRGMLSLFGIEGQVRTLPTMLTTLQSLAERGCTFGLWSTDPLGTFATIVDALPADSIRSVSSFVKALEPALSEKLPSLTNLVSISTSNILSTTVFADVPDFGRHLTHLYLDVDALYKACRSISLDRHMSTTTQMVLGLTAASPLQLDRGTLPLWRDFLLGLTRLPQLTDLQLCFSGEASMQEVLPSDDPSIAFPRVTRLSIRQWAYSGRSILTVFPFEALFPNTQRLELYILSSSGLGGSDMIDMILDLTPLAPLARLNELRILPSETDFTMCQVGSARGCISFFGSLPHCRGFRSPCTVSLTDLATAVGLRAEGTWAVLFDNLQSKKLRRFDRPSARGGGAGSNSNSNSRPMYELEASGNSADGEPVRRTGMLSSLVPPNTLLVGTWRSGPTRTNWMVLAP